MSAIGPGDFVECVDASPHPDQGPDQVASLQQLVEGGAYVVTGIGNRGRGGPPSLFLAGVTASREGRGWGWRAVRFRPIYRPKASLITDLLTKAPKELEPA